MDEDPSIVYDKEYYKKRTHYESRKDRIRKFLKAITETNPKRVLDVGCGQGFLVKALLERGIDATGIDYSRHAGKQIPDNFYMTEADLLPYPDNYFDVVFSSDFFEHLEEDEIDDVAEEMKRVGKRVIAKVSYKPQPPYHKTVKPREWWEKKLQNVQLL